LSIKSKHSFNLYQYSKLSQGNNFTNQSIPVNEGSFTNDQILKVITGDRGYSFQTDYHPIEMVEAGCGQGALYYRNQMDHRSKNPVYSNSLEELEERLLEDILNHIDCQPGSDMK